MTTPASILNKTDLPTASKHRFGLRSVGDFKVVSDPHWLNGIEWEERCGVGVGTAYMPCDPANPANDPETPTDFVKTAFDIGGVREAYPFPVYSMVECGILVEPEGGYKTVAREELVLGEDRAVETRFAIQVLADSVSPFAAPATDAKKALAGLLARWDGAVEPLVHLTPNLAVALGDSIVKVGNHLELRTGESVSVGYGYAAGLGISDTSIGGIFLTGPVFARYGTLVELEGYETTLNRKTALAERPWIVSHLCDALRATVTGVGIASTA